MKKLYLKKEAPDAFVFCHGVEKFQFSRADQPFLLEDAVAETVMLSDHFTEEAPPKAENKSKKEND